LDVYEARILKGGVQCFVVPGVLMLAVLTEMIVDVVEVGPAPVRMPTPGDGRPIGISGIAVRFENLCGLGNYNVENAAGLKNTKRFAEKVRNFCMQLEVLEDVLAVNIRD
jgi:hypothetical protein